MPTPPPGSIAAQPFSRFPGPQIGRAPLPLESGPTTGREHDFRPATVLFAAVEAQDDLLPPWVDQISEPADYRQCLDLIREGLTPDELSEAQQEGKAMTLEQAVDYALQIFDRSDRL